MIAIMSTAIVEGGPAAPADWPEALRALARPQAVNAGQTLFARGAKPRQVFWVERGEVRLQRASSDGRLIVLQRVRRGFLAEASLQAAAYHCDGWVAQGGLVWSFPSRPLRDALAESNALALWWAGRLAQQLRDARMRCERLSLHTARERVLHALETEGQDGVLTLPPLRKDWADELGLSPEALYRTLAALQREGVVALREGRLHRV
jgi:CRP-like cAMP-binding protein